MKKFSKKLERKVFQRTNQLEIKTIKLELINNDLESFNHICSHDLQEPLRKIQMFISQVSDTEFDNLSEEGKHKLERIDLSAARMRNLIQDLLAYGSTETIDNSLTTVSLKKLVDEVKDVLSEELKEHKTVLRVQKDCEITVRPIQFKQLLFNLFTNAIKFSKREDKPVIKAYYEERWAELEDSKSDPVFLSIDALKALHSKWVYFLRKLTDVQLNKIFIHPSGNKEVSLKENICIYAWHSKHHFAHIEELMIREGWK